MKKKTVLIVVAVIVVIGGAAFVSHSRGAAKASAGAKAPSLPVPVTVATSVAKDVPVQMYAIGTVHAYSTVSVKSNQKGELVQVGFKEGDEVKQGDLIFTIDPRPYDAALKQAQAFLERDKALLEKAKADFERGKELLKSDSIPQSTYDQWVANVDSLKATILADEAAINNAKVQLGYCTIRSPITGRIGTLLINQGNIIKDVDTVLAVINQIKPIYVDFYVPEKALQDVRDAVAKAKLKVVASLPQHEEHHAEGELMVINNEVDTTTGSILLRAVFPNQDEMLWPGQFVNAALTLSVKKDAVVVPSQAIQPSQQGDFVFVVKSDMTVESRSVVSGPTIGQETVVAKGLGPQEQVVTSGQLRLIPGSKVEIKTAENNSGKKS